MLLGAGDPDRATNAPTAQVAAGVPYLGFSAGAAIAAEAALVGGWRIGDVPVSPEEASEELDEITVAPEGSGNPTDTSTARSARAVNTPSTNPIAELATPMMPA